MSSSGTRISSLRVTYQEQYHNPSWPSNSTSTHGSIERSGNPSSVSTLPAQSLAYNSVESNHDTASVPGDQTLEDVCDCLEPDSLFSHTPLKPTAIGSIEGGVPQSHAQIQYMNSSNHQGNPSNHYNNGPNHQGNPTNHYDNGPDHQGNPTNHYGNDPNHCGNPTSHYERGCHQGNLLTIDNPPPQPSYPNSYKPLSIHSSESQLHTETTPGYSQNAVTMDTRTNGQFPSDPAILYGLEDKLRHKINVHIENFRADIQEEFYEQFGHYRQSFHSQHTSQWDAMDRCAPGCVSHQPDTMASQDVIGDGSCCSVYSNSESSTVCSGVGGPSHTTGCDQGVNQIEDDKMNVCLIKLQTYAAAISSTLRRTEYAVT